MKKVINNSFFGDYNPYAEKLWGDWLVAPTEYDIHPGDVYINGKSMYEAKSLEEVYTAPRRDKGADGNHNSNAEDSIYQWRAVVDDENTTLYCNFQNFNPNEEPYENPDGTPIDFTIDMNGEKREETVVPGPFAKLQNEQILTVWK